MNANICVCLANTDFDACYEAAMEYPLVELRLDLLDLSQVQINQLLQCKAAAIVTCRADKYNGNERLQRLISAVEAGAVYVDIEVEAPDNHRKTLTDCALKNNCQTIISYHNFDLTPPVNELQSIAAQIASMNANIIKIVTMARSVSDAARIMSLYEDSRNSLVAFAMGEAGKITRISAPFLGAPFTYTALSDSSITANGQFTAKQMQQIYSKIVCP